MKTKNRAQRTAENARPCVMRNRMKHVMRNRMKHVNLECESMREVKQPPAKYCVQPWLCCSPLTMQLILGSAMLLNEGKDAAQ